MNSFHSVVGLDFETANSCRSSVCAVAAVKYLVSGEKVAEYYTLVNPKEEFDFFNILIHGITPDMVVDSPEIAEAMLHVFELVDPDSLIVCHNSAFDFSVLRAAHNKQSFIIPDLTFTCTYRLSTRLINNLISYTLPNVAAACGINDINHHYALSDADVCVKILLHMLNDFHGDLDLMHEQANLKYGHIINGEYDGVHKTIHESVKKINRCSTYDLSEFNTDESSPFYGKTVGFTGKMESMTRSEAIEIINRIGGIGIDGLTAKTDYLVIGYLDPKKLAGKEKSNKQIAAEKMLAKGRRIEIIPEDDFIKMI